LNKSVPSSVSNALKQYPESIWVSMFFAVYGLAIAILKDVPDIAGDKIFNIMSYSVVKGPDFMLA
jgi:4-hydroxybenzoate polyprenyltransferase